MPSATPQVLRRQVQFPQFVKVRGSQGTELIQELAQRLSFTLSSLRQAVKRIKHPRLAELQDNLGSRHPISSFAVNQMTNDIEYAPGVSIFVSARPHVGQIAQKRIECRQGAAEDGNRVREVVFRRVLVRRRFGVHTPDSIRSTILPNAA
jgi:hypothetical protein